jgi:hypothetical protein
VRELVRLGIDEVQRAQNEERDDDAQEDQPVKRADDVGSDDGVGTCFGQDSPRVTR